MAPLANCGWWDGWSCIVSFTIGLLARLATVFPWTELCHDRVVEIEAALVECLNLCEDRGLCVSAADTSGPANKAMGRSQRRSVVTMKGNHRGGRPDCFKRTLMRWEWKRDGRTNERKTGQGCEAERREQRIPRSFLLHSQTRLLGYGFNGGSTTQVRITVKWHQGCRGRPKIRGCNLSTCICVLWSDSGLIELAREQCSLGTSNGEAAAAQPKPSPSSSPSMRSRMFPTSPTTNASHDSSKPSARAQQRAGSISSRPFWKHNLRLQCYYNKSDPVFAIALSLLADNVDFLASLKFFANVLRLRKDLQAECRRAITVSYECIVRVWGGSSKISAHQLAWRVKSSKNITFRHGRYSVSRLGMLAERRQAATCAGRRLGDGGKCFMYQESSNCIDWSARSMEQRAAQEPQLLPSEPKVSVRDGRRELHVMAGVTSIGQRLF